MKSMTIIGTALFAMSLLTVGPATAGIEVTSYHNEIIATVTNCETLEYDQDQVADVLIHHVDLDVEAALVSRAHTWLQADLVIEPQLMRLLGNVGSKLSRKTPGTAESLLSGSFVELRFHVSDAASFSLELSGVMPVAGQSVVLRNLLTGQMLVALTELDDTTVVGNLKANVEYSLCVRCDHAAVAVSQPFSSGSGISYDFRVIAGVVATESTSLSRIKALFE